MIGTPITSWQIFSSHFDTTQNKFKFPDSFICVDVNEILTQDSDQNMAFWMLILSLPRSD